MNEDLFERLDRTNELLERIADALEKQHSFATTFADQMKGDHSPEEDPDYLANIAAETEAAILGAATPKVSRKVEVTSVSEETKKVELIDIYAQNRTKLSDLIKRAPKDRWIEEVVKRVEMTENELIPEALRLEITALEIVYTYLPRDIWGTDTAREQIDALIGAHDGTMFHT